MPSSVSAASRGTVATSGATTALCARSVVVDASPSSAIEITAGASPFGLCGGFTTGYLFGRFRWALGTLVVQCQRSILGGSLGSRDLGCFGANGGAPSFFSGFNGGASSLVSLPMEEHGGALGVRDATSVPGRPPPLPDSQRMVRYSGPEAEALLLRELSRQKTRSSAGRRDRAARPVGG